MERKTLNSLGVELVQRLSGPHSWIARIHWSPGGEAIAAASKGAISVWSTRKDGKLLFQHGKESSHVYNAIWRPDGTVIGSSHSDRLVKFWDALDGHKVDTLEVVTDYAMRGAGEFRHDVGKIHGFTWSPDGTKFATGALNGITMWQGTPPKQIRRLEGSTDAITILWSPDGKYIASTSYSPAVRIWLAETGELLHTFKASYGPALAWSPDSKLLATAQNRVIQLWNLPGGTLSKILEGHNNPVRGLTFSYDGKLLASRDGPRRTSENYRKILIWQTDRWEAVGEIQEMSGWYLYAPIAFSPTDYKLATSGNGDVDVHIWNVEQLTAADIPPLMPTTFYKTAKVALLGDAGVGKSALGMVLAGEKFVPTESTHGRRIWTLGKSTTKVGSTREEIRELILWDLAGQPGYRLIHQLYLEDLSLGLIVFDARNELDPFSGVRHWHRALQQVSKTSSSKVDEILVAARCDRGHVAVSQNRIRILVQSLGCVGYEETSAKDGIGIRDLRELIESNINWDSVPTVSSIRLFQKIKKFIKKEKDKGEILTTLDNLISLFGASARLNKERTQQLRPDFITCVNRLQALGLLREFSFGNVVLLRPEFLDAYASALIFAAQDEPDGMGSITEDRARSGKFPIPRDQRLKDPEKERLLLLATIEDLIRHDVTIVESTNSAQLLVFPSQLTRENPDIPDPEGKATIVEFQGAVLNIYATLVVRLTYSEVFRKHEMWKNAVVFKTGNDSSCGLFLTEKEEGRGSITTFFAASTPLEIRLQFDDYVHSHIIQRAVTGSVVRSHVFQCPDPLCATPVTELAVKKRRDRGYDWIECNVCHAPISLVEAAVSVEVQTKIAQMEISATRSRRVEVALVSATGEMHTAGFRRWAGGTLGTLALVFTDIVGSTALGVSLGDEKMAQIRRAHFMQGRFLLKKYSGYLIKTIGDSLMVAFRSAVEALDFALTFQMATGHEALRIRAGIHIGPVEIDEEDVFGTMVNYAARVVGAAPGAEVWLSDRAYQDVLSRKSDHHARLRFIQHVIELKGFAGAQTLWSVAQAIPELV